MTPALLTLRQCRPGGDGLGLDLCDWNVAVSTHRQMSVPDGVSSWGALAMYTSGSRGCRVVSRSV